MEQDEAKNIIQKIFLILGVFIALVSIIGIAFWLLFYSVETANLSFIIPTRNWYQDTYSNIESRFVAPNSRSVPYEFLVAKELGDNSFEYHFYGKFNSVDFASNKITLNHYNSLYIFSLKSPPDINVDSSGVVLTNIYSNAQYIEIDWTDSRSLSQIKGNYYSNPQNPINLNQPVTIKILK